MFLHNACDTQTVCPCEKYEVAVLCFFRRGDVTLTCETRLNPDGPGYQMVITEQAQERIENFTELPKLLAREHELLMVWRAQGWRDVGQPTRTPVDTWTGPR